MNITYRRRGRKVTRPYNGPLTRARIQARRDEAAALLREVPELPPCRYDGARRKALAMLGRFCAGDSYAEVARMYRVSREHVTVIISRCLDRLRMLADERRAP